MKISRPIALAIIPLLFACYPKKPEIHLNEVPSAPLVQMLEQRQQSFSGLKAIVSIETVRSGRKRAYDTVGIIIDGQRRLHMEAYGPLGQSLVTLVWNGTDMAVRLDDGRVVRPGQAGLERILGVAIDARELCAVLSGNIPALAPSTTTRAFREPDGSFLTETTDRDMRRLVHVLLPKAGSGQGIRIIDSELYRSDKLIYRVRYEEMEQISGYLIPKSLHMENPEKKISMEVVYNETDVNVPLKEDSFRLPEEGAVEP
ncbi:MAG TPA: hypothetical protein VEM40_01485 [Nitrospirota bacterium]|nr:hypothetical protein [Nitrospirota bacterium]